MTSEARTALPVMTYEDFERLTEGWARADWETGLLSGQLDLNPGLPRCPECRHRQTDRKIARLFADPADPLVPYVAFECGHRWRLENEPAEA
jgi:hypothetical protein